MSLRASTETPPVAGPPGTPPAPPVSKRRLWLAIAIPPLAWALSELVGYILVSRSCEPGWNGLSAHGVNQPGVVLTTIAIVMALVSAGMLVVAAGSWRVLDDRRVPNDRATRASSGSELPLAAPLAAAPEWSRARFMAFAGIFVSALCGLGILFWSVPPFFLDVCNQVR